MNNNFEPAGGAGTEVAEPPAQDITPQAARVEIPAQAPQNGQFPMGASTYPLYPPDTRPETPRPQLQPQPEYTPQPIQQPVVQKGGNTALIVLLAVIGAVIFLGLIFVVAVVFFVSNIVGQVTSPEVGELRTETQSVTLGEASSVVVDVNMGVGRLNISGGATDLMNSTFRYNVASWKPTVSYNVNGTTGILLIRQPNQGAINSGGNVRYEWDVRFGNDVPMTMKVDLGVGDGDLRFGGLDLSRLEVNSGVGNTTIDLTGQWKQDVDVLVNGGVGNVTIILPTDTGVRITAEGGLGKVNANGLTVNGNTYTNSAYSTSASTLNINVQTGIGNIELVQSR